MNILELNSQYLEKEESASDLLMFEGVNIHTLWTGNRNNTFIQSYSPNLWTIPHFLSYDFLNSSTPSGPVSLRSKAEQKMLIDCTAYL